MVSSPKRLLDHQESPLPAVVLAYGPSTLDVSSTLLRVLLEFRLPVRSLLQALEEVRVLLRKALHSRRRQQLRRQ